MRWFNKQAHDDYVQSGRWKCEQSPTGAHYWIGDSRMIKCKYCGKEQKIVEYVGPLQEKGLEVARRKVRRSAKSHTKLQSI